MTQAELARQAHVSLPYISKLETAGAAPGLDLLDRLAKALGTTVTDLVPTEGSPDTSSVLREASPATLMRFFRLRIRKRFSWSTNSWPGLPNPLPGVNAGSCPSRGNVCVSSAFVRVHTNSKA